MRNIEKRAHEIRLYVGKIIKSLQNPCFCSTSRTPITRQGKISCLYSSFQVSSFDGRMHLDPSVSTLPFQTFVYLGVLPAHDLVDDIELLVSQELRAHMKANRPKHVTI